MAVHRAIEIRRLQISPELPPRKSRLSSKFEENKNFRHSHNLQDELHRILARTQDLVIDVSHIDSLAGILKLIFVGIFELSLFFSSGLSQYGGRGPSEFANTMIRYTQMLKDAKPDKYKKYIADVERTQQGSLNFMRIFVWSGVFYRKRRSLYEQCAEHDRQHEINDVRTDRDDADR